MSLIIELVKHYTAKLKLERVRDEIFAFNFLHQIIIRGWAIIHLEPPDSLHKAPFIKV